MFPYEKHISIIIFFIKCHSPESSVNALALWHRFSSIFFTLLILFFSLIFLFSFWFCFIFFFLWWPCWSSYRFWILHSPECAEIFSLGKSGNSLQKYIYIVRLIFPILFKTASQNNNNTTFGLICACVCVMTRYHIEFHVWWWCKW